MSYVTIADVQARMPQFTLTPVSKPNIVDAAMWIDDIEAEINAALSVLGYVVPGSGPTGLSIVKAWASQGVIWRILTARAASVGGDAAVSSATRAQLEYENKFKQLADPKNPLELVDWARTADAVLKPDSGLSGPSMASGMGMLEGAGFIPRVWMGQEF